jgi:hypothetical protein
MLEVSGLVDCDYFVIVVIFLSGLFCAIMLVFVHNTPADLVASVKDTVAVRSGGVQSSTETASHSYLQAAICG